MIRSLHIIFIFNIKYKYNIDIQLSIRVKASRSEDVFVVKVFANNFFNVIFCTIMCFPSQEVVLITVHNTNQMCQVTSLVQIGHHKLVACSMTITWNILCTISTFTRKYIRLQCTYTAKLRTIERPITFLCLGCLAL